MITGLLTVFLAGYFAAPSARALALGGVPLSGYQDPATSWLNPAFLSVKQESHVQLGHVETPIGVPAVISRYKVIDSLSRQDDFRSRYNLGYYVIPIINSQSNVFSPNVLYDFFFSDRTLSDADKEAFLSKFKDGYATLRTDLGLFDLNVSSGGFNISLSHTTYLKFRLPRPIFELVLYGNELDRRYSLNSNNTYFEELSSVNLSVAYSHEFDVKGIPVSLGAGLRFTRVIPFSELVQATGDEAPPFEFGYLRLNSIDFSVLTDTEKIVIEGGRTELLFGAGKVATGVDIGLVASPYPDLNIGFALVNIGARLNFTSNDSMMVMIFGADTIEGIFGDSVEIKPDTVFTVSAEGQSASMPHIARLTATYQFSDIPTTPSVGAELRFVLNESVALNKGTILSLATEVHPTTWLPLRFSLSFGDPDGVLIGYGFGLRLKGMHFDFGFQNVGGLGAGSRGGRMISNFWFSI